MFFNSSLKKIFAFTGLALLTSVTGFAQMRSQPSTGTAPGDQTNSGTQQPGSTPPTADNNQPGGSLQPMTDKAFVREALQGGMAEVQLGQLAAQKGSSDDVKQFGQKMVDDHTKLNTAMLQVAQQLGVKPPTNLSKKDKELKTKLEGLSGQQFDDAYIEAMVKDHKKDESSFMFEAQQAQIPSVKQAAQQGEPVIASHLQMIDQIAQAHNVEHGKSKSSGM